MSIEAETVKMFSAPQLGMKSMFSTLLGLMEDQQRAFAALRARALGRGGLGASARLRGGRVRVLLARARGLESTSLDHGRCGHLG